MQNSTGKLFALKVISKDAVVKYDLLKAVLNESKALQPSVRSCTAQCLNHPNADPGSGFGTVGLGWCDIA